MVDYLQDLNPAQRSAVTQIDGPSLVIAGAGSGKTRVLTYKIVWMLQNGVSPSNILALTFTNKAAREMKERIASLVGDKYSRYLWMGTFHSVFSKILRQEAEKIGFTHDYTIYDSQDSKSLIKQIVKEMELDDKIYRAPEIAARISMAKNNLLTPADYASNQTFEQQDRINRRYRMADIFFTYNNRLRQANAMDFDDLLLNMYKLLKENKAIREKYQSIFQYILIDEYQDTNYCQACIIKLLAAPQNNICVVGDDAQSIYSFRGANIDNILDFANNYAGTHVFKLERNYRSTKNIVGAANSLIKQNLSQIPKEVYSENEDGDKLQLSVLENDREEATYIARTIQGEHRSYDDFAVLYRTNAQSRVIEDEFRKFNIPYRIYGSVSFYQRKEIKDAISYFRLIVNNQDDEALLRVINLPARGIGDTTMRKVLNAAHTANTFAFNVVAQPNKYNLPVSTGTYKKLTNFASLILSLKDKLAVTDAYTFAKDVLSQTSLLSSAMLDTTQEGQDRYENLQELMSSIHEFVDEQSKLSEPQFLITDFLAEVSLLTDQDEHLDDYTPRVSLMTVHAAKGLEFPIVFVAGMEEKLFPSMFAQTIKDLEEERRLFYVAITRAKQQCYLTHAKQRFRNGQIMFSTPSHFLKDIDDNFIEKNSENLSQRKTTWSMPWLDDIENIYNPQPQAANLKPLPVKDRQIKQNFSHPLYSVGARISHSVFGKGTVKEIFKENENEKIIIDFDERGIKTLLLKYAKLEVV